MSSLLDFFQNDFVINILDIGAAYVEEPEYQPLIDAGKARIIGFEPDPEECRQLNQRYGHPHRFFPNFIGDGQSATFYETNCSVTGSLFEPNTPLLEKFQNLAEIVTPITKHAVSTTRVDDIEDIDDVDFIKIDIQGSELAVFKGASRLLSTTLIIQTEVAFVELYKKQPMFSDVDSYLRHQGFQFHTFHSMGSRCFKPLIFNNEINVGLRQALWSDALYVRDWMHLEILSESKLQKYAILAHDLLKSFDLAHFILSALDKKSGSNFSEKYLESLINGAPMK